MKMAACHIYQPWKVPFVMGKSEAEASKFSERSMFSRRTWDWMGRSKAFGHIGIHKSEVK